MNGGVLMVHYKDYKKNALSQPEVKTAYEDLQAEYYIIQALLKARSKQNMTQKELARITVISQTDISLIEMVLEIPA